MSSQRRGGGAAAASFRALVPDSIRPWITSLYRPLLYRGDRVECPCCGGTFSRFVQHRGRPNVRCPRCGAMERHRLLWPYLRERTDLLTARHRVLHVAPEWPFLRLLRERPNLDYVTADLESKLADEHFDLQDIPHPNASFDVILCNHVLEHIPDDRRAMQEIHRVLRPSGWAVLMCPIGRGRDQTLENPSVCSSDDRLRVYGQEDHMRLYGTDYAGRLREAGLDVRVERPLVELPERAIERRALRQNHELFEDDAIYVASKPAQD